MSSNNKLMDEYGITSIVNYLRKSRQDEDRERKTGEDTLHEQKQLMDRVLSEYGIPYDQRPEIGSGDKIASRPVFQQVIKDLENGKYDAIAVKEISRMGRGSYSDMGTIYDLIIEKRIFIITPWKIYDPTNPADLRQIRFELFMSREEFETTRERLTGGRYNAAMEGKWVAGPAPFGYNYNPNTKKLEINEQEAEIIRTIFDYYAYGIVVNGRRKLVQFRALSTYMKRLGIKTPKGKDTWHPTYLKDFLSNDIYTGTLRFRTTQRISNGLQIPRPEEEHIIVKDAHPAIIDLDAWNRTQERIENRDTTNTKLDFEPCELASLCVCKKCGRKMIRQSSVQHYKKKDGSTSIYRKEFLWCGEAGCTFVKYRSVEDDLLEVLKYLKDLDQGKLSKQIDHIVVNEDEENGPTVEDIEKNIRLRREELDRRMKFVYEKYESRIYTDEMFLNRKADIDKELEELDKINVDDQVCREEKEIDVSITQKNITSVLGAYRNAERTSDKNNLLRSVFDHVDVEVLEKGRGRRPAVHRITPYLKSSFLFKKVVD